MARPRKWRKVCSLPERTSFGPVGLALTPEVITLNVDEYESIRLIDLEEMTQEECADKMHIARTTVQGMYTSARRKIAESLVNGKTLRIEGGQYELCNGNGASCDRRRCRGRNNGIGCGGASGGRAGRKQP